MDRFVSTPNSFAVNATSAVTVSFAITCLQFLSVPQLGDDETYSMTISTNGQVTIIAFTSTGVSRALSAVLQMIGTDVATKSATLPLGVTIVDTPKHKWRGLLVDVVRRFQPVDALKRLCDGMEYARLNVMHLHLTDDQAFRFESKLWPLMHQKNPDGNYLTQAQLSDLVSYCAVAGIRVVPEINVPGHAAAMIYAYPVLAPSHVPPSPITAWGVFDYTLDPSRPIVTQCLKDLYSEVSQVFPDKHIHTGGDEVIWAPTTQAQTTWMTSLGLTTDTLLNYFQTQILFPIVVSLGKTPIGWSDTQDYRPQGVALWQWWRSSSAASAGTSIVSTNQYLDSMKAPEGYYNSYMVQPDDLGGEVLAWAESLSQTMVEARVFPTALATAELFWRGSLNLLSTNGMLHRFHHHDRQLSLLGLLHRRAYAFQTDLAVRGTSWTYADLVGTATAPALPFISFLDLLVPTSSMSSYNDPLTDWIDGARPHRPALQFLVWLAQSALSTELLDPSKPATTMLTQALLNITRMTSATTTSTYVVKDMIAIASAYLNWITTVQSGVDGSVARTKAIATGDILYPGNFAPSRVVSNGLKAVLEPVLLAVDVGPYFYSATTSSSSSTSGPVSSSTGSAAQVQSPSTFSVPGLAAGLSIGLTILIVASLIVAFFIYRRKKLLKSVATASSAAAAPPLPPPPPNRDSFLAVDPADVALADFVVESDDDDTTSLLAEYAFRQESVTESISSTTISTVSEDNDEHKEEDFLVDL